MSEVAPVITLPPLPQEPGRRLPERLHSIPPSRTPAPIAVAMRCRLQLIGQEPQQ